MDGSFLRFRLEPKKPRKITAVPEKKRTRTGCLTCRARRKKCDELKPTCLACSRNYLHCRWAQADGPSADAEIASQSTASEAREVKGAAKRLSRGMGKLDASSDIRSLHTRYKGLDSYLLEHYICITAHQLAGREQFENPFLEHLLPMAYQDGKVMEGLMAVSGAHLSSSAGRFEPDARLHYAAAVRSVKSALMGWRGLGSSDLAGLLTSMLLLCYFESIIGDTNGTIFYHLRASRAVLQELLSRDSPEIDPTILDFLTEWYAFSAISANVTLHANFASINRDIPLDDFLSPDALENLNKGHPSYGVLFGSAHRLLGLIMPISQAARRLSREPDENERQDTLRSFESKIQAYSTTVPTAHFTASETAASIYQQALLIYLYTLFHGTSPPNLSLYARIDPCIDRVFELMRGVLPFSAALTTLMWPALIIGSCIRDPSQQAVLLACMESLPIRMGSCKRMREVLASVYGAREEDERIYGPYGLETVMGREGVSLCVT